ncbi:hypothetical protein OVY01_12450 [Robbsia sp. Bb-Pol-6]|uniref:Uncharacterized protein n=1 Tax=Robbsia betulipollinis TaxID=2981849 RepID=A0ABT3ZNJ8_9BURK|nr:hypothetical protein [Robbsia betulipollinis]MCY0388032.1 hypothetical protein [Robbsia betulipollinis]
MSDRNRPAIAVILPADDPGLPDDPQARDARLDQQLAFLERIVNRARRRAASGPAGAADDDDGEDVERDSESDDSESDDAETELKPRNGLLC